MRVIVVACYSDLNNVVVFSGAKAFKAWMRKEKLKFLEYTYEGEKRTSEYSLVYEGSKETDDPEFTVHYDMYVWTAKDVESEPSVF